MKRWTVWTLNVLMPFLALVGTASAFQGYATSATRADLRELRSDAQALDDSMQQVPSGHPRAAEFQRREDQLRDRLVALRREIRQQGASDDTGASKADVEALRRDIALLRDEIDGTVSDGSRQVGDVQVPDGTEIRVRLDEDLSSKTARPEDRVVARLAEPIRVDGRIAVPAGARVQGSVEDVEAARRPSHGGRLELSFNSFELSGQTVDMRARVVKVEEGGLDAKKTGLGALLGGVVGAVVGGTKGALVGAIVGGAGSVAATRGQEVEMPAGTVLTLRLDRAISVARR